MSNNGNGNGNGVGVSIRDAARALGLSERSIHRYVRRLGVQVRHVYTLRGRAVELTPADVERIAGEIASRCPTGAERRQVSDTPLGDAAGGNGQASSQVSDSWPTGATLPAVRGADLELLRETIRTAIADGVRDALKDLQRQAPKTSRTVERVQSACYAMLAAGLVGVLALVIVAGVRLGTWAQLARWIAGG